MSSSGVLMDRQGRRDHLLVDCVRADRDLEDPRSCDRDVDVRGVVVPGTSDDKRNGQRSKVLSRQAQAGV